MSAFQGAIYDWIRSTGTLRIDPEDEMHKVQKNPMYQVKMYKNLNNRCMELRKVCNHPLLNYPYFNDYSKNFIVRSCGKLWILDRILIKLHKAGHRVLLFSTMTKLLDILEEYLHWRRLVYRRIDGTTTLEDRESAIVDFNSPDSDCFIFLLSIRAAGRGLNLQTADTVVIYDPDPNPQNEEQAVARAHRIGQTREVKVIYLEAVVDKVSSYQKEDEMRNGGAGDSEDDLAGKDRYVGSIESLIRNNIQQYKIDMADEVINAGRFDQRTTHEERRLTLETLLHDEERYQETVHNVPSLQEVNRMIARSEEEVELFDQMDEELDWTGDMVKYNEVPKWLRASSRELDSVVASLSKKPSKNILSSTIELESNGMLSSPNKTDRRRGRPKNSTVKKYPTYKESDDEENGDSDVDTDERNTFEEEGDVGDFEDEELFGAGDVLPSNKDQAEEGLVCDSGGDEFSLAMEGSKDVHAFDEAGSTGSSSDELEEGEIAVSGDSLMDLHQSDSLVYDHDDLDDDQVVQPKIKRKRSIRLRPRFSMERTEDKSSSHRAPFHHGSWPLLQAKHEKLAEFNAEEFEAFGEAGSGSQDRSSPPLKQRCTLPSRVISPPVVQKSGRMSASAEDGYEHSMESWNSKAISSSGPSFVATRMTDSTQRKVKYEVGKLQDMFFDIMKIAFPDADFREAKNAVMFSSSSGAATPSPRLASADEAKRQAPTKTETGLGPGKALAHGSTPAHDERKTRSGASKIHKESRSIGGSARQQVPECSQLLAHPGDLVICKKKRKDRDKSAMKQLSGPTSPSNPGRMTPLAPTNQGSLGLVTVPSMVRNNGAPIQGDSRPAQQAISPLGRAQHEKQQVDRGSGVPPGIRDVKWAKPVKRMRTDTGKRRPSQM
ncbi:hypothetical protein B296_00047547 [Ensete ventricosum]|uniref:Helicase C-terminal domain-containing protein n=1 Tax=Ensete ventricosum TaxID=4639 RepID=A0A426YYZ8_ENSVE|nr:hypothetical protein B296_00047547 [Ensete ventricosum]